MRRSRRAVGLRRERRPSLRSVHDATFDATVKRWMRERGDVFVVVRFASSAGAKSFEWISSPDAWDERIAELPIATSIAAFAEPQLPLRGVVDESFIARAKALVGDGQEWLAVGTTPVVAGSESWIHDASGESHAEMDEELRDDSMFGDAVCFGPYPLFWMEDGPHVISAYVPTEDGRVVPGAY